MWLWRRACGCAASRAVSALVGEQKKRENDERNRFARSIEPRRSLDRASVFRPSPSFEHGEQFEEARVVHGCLFFLGVFFEFKPSIDGRERRALRLALNAG
jgi:hypothetical protein